ncbi:MAG: DUF3868 domain-containing protein [Rikenellaceae bacterium]
MNRYITILLVAFVAYTTATAQNNTQTILGAKVNIHDFEYEADSVKLNLEFDLDSLKIGPNQSVVFVPKVYKGENTYDLPTLVVRRRGGAKSYDRAEVLENTKSQEAYNEWYGSPYQIIEFYGSDKESAAQYNLTIPYESWMVESKLYVDCSTCGCCSAKDVGAIIPDDNTLFIDIPSVGNYHFRPQVELIKPEKVAVKRRDIEYSSALIFKVNF